MEREQAMLNDELIDGMAIFSGFSKKERKAFCRLNHTLLEFKEGDWILKEDEISNDLYLLLKGNCQVTRTQDEKTIQLAKLSAGELFGEMSMISNLPRRSNVVAKNDVVTLKMDMAFFDKIPQKMSTKIHRYLISLLCARLDKMNEAIMRISSLMNSR